MAKSVAIIPARGGSKRIPKKNIKDFHGKPLIAYSIEIALSSGLFERVIVSTDDEEIAKVAKEYGAEIPFIRPQELSSDTADSEDVIKHMLSYLKSIGEVYDFVCTIYATAPLMQHHYLVQGYEALQTSDAVNAFSATSMPFPIQRSFFLDKEGRCEMFMPQFYNSRSQELVESYQDAGQFYWTNLHKTPSQVMFSHESIPIILPRYLVQDIDTLEDWRRAEIMYEVINR